MRGAACLGVALLGATVTGLGAQEPAAAPSAALVGTVFDSLAMAPLGGAEVQLGGGVATARADAQGRFALRAPPGEYTVTFSHRGVSPWAALHHAAVVLLTEGRATSVSLATASAGTVLDRTCPGQGAVVGGTVMDLLTLVPLGAASVDVRAGAGRGARTSTVRTAPDGAYFACLGGGGAGVEVAARLGNARSRAVTLAGGASVRVQDLYVQASRPAELRGTVVDGSSGAPVSGAGVEVAGTRLRALTRDDGTFTFRGVPPGAIRLAVQRIGYGRAEATVAAEGGTTAEVTFELFPEAVATDSVVVTVAGGTPDRLRAGTRFDGLTRAQIDALLPRVVAFDDLLRNANIPGLRVREVQYRSRGGAPARWGICVETSRRSTYAFDECQMVEVYLDGVLVAESEFLLEALDPGSIERFEVLSALEAGIQYMGTVRARNGILLIWTRGR